MRQILVKEGNSFSCLKVDGQCTRENLGILLTRDHNLVLKHLYFNGVECYKPVEYYVDTEPLVALVTRGVKIRCRSAAVPDAVDLGQFEYSDHIHNVRRKASDQLGMVYARTAIYVGAVNQGGEIEVGSLLAPTDAGTTGVGILDIEIRDEPIQTGKMFPVAIRTLTGKCVPMETYADEYVRDFKHRFGQIEDMPPDQMRLIFAGKQLEPSEKIGNYGIQTESTIHLVLRLRGGGRGPCSFVDVSDEGVAVTKAWSREAPNWRIAEHGLCLEGVCKNPKCKAFRSPVLCNERFGAIDMIGHECSCPICRCIVKPKSCGFNNCAYKICGKKVDHAATSSEFKCVGNGFKYFGEASGGTVEWERLMIVTRPILEYKTVANGEFCPICLEKMAGCCTTPCEHKFHPNCIGAWISLNPSCPLCRMQLAVADGSHTPAKETV